MEFVSLASCSCAIGCSVDERTLTGPQPPIVVSTFEADSLQSDDPRFGAWTSFSFGADPFNPPLALVGSNNSVWCLSTGIDLTRSSGTAAGTPGVGLQLPAPTAVDLSAYTQLVFTHQYLPDASCLAAQNFTAIFNCNAISSSFQVVGEPSADWVVRALPFTQFGEAPYPEPSGVPRVDCLRQVSSIGFTITTGNLAVGDCMAGTLLLDNVSIR